MQLALRVIAILSFLVAIIWMIVAPGFEPLFAFLAGVTSLLVSLSVEKSKGESETLDQRNRRVMLNHVENFWVKGLLEKSLHGAALLELGIKEDPTAVTYPWTIKKGSTNETLPAGKSMLKIFDEIGMGRSLLLLGAPGSGKTTMLLELTRQLIERARKDETEPLPVVFNLASWKEKQVLADWLAEQLNIVYYVPKKTAPSWVNENKMSLLLDGLDEVKQDRRARCVDAINQFRKEHGLTSLIVCCRIEEYVVVQTKLSLAGAITLQPLTSEQVNDYFDKFGERLASVKQLLKKDKSLQELAETPLMLSIMALAYKDTKADELIGSKNIEEQRKYIFNSYIQRMFERSTRTVNAPFSKQQTLHYLSWLARKMIQHNIITYQIEAMQPDWLEDISGGPLYRSVVVLSFRLSFGLIAGLNVGLSVGPIAGLIAALSVGLISGLMVGEVGGSISEINMETRLKWSLKKGRRGLIGGLIFGLIFGPFFGLSLGLSSRPIFGLSSRLIFGLIFGLIAGLSAGLSGEQIEETTRPGQRLKQMRTNAFFAFMSSGLIFGLFFGLLAWPIGGLSIQLIIRGLIGGLFIGLFIGLIVGLLYGFVALIQHYTLRFVLVRYELIPKRLIPFLDYAVDLIFLRRVGGSYIFVHRLLMAHFAEMDP
jgi:MFS family permease